MQDLQLLEAVERYISGEMHPEERFHFENLRKSNPEVDQMVVEHTYFLQQMNRFDEVKNLKTLLHHTHTELAEGGFIESPRLKGRTRIAYLYNRYKKVAAIAASIAGVTALSISILVSSISPSKNAKDQDYETIKRDLSYTNNKVNEVINKNRKLEKDINSVKDKTAVTTPPIEYKSGGTGFLIDTKGYLVTNAHVIGEAQHIAVQRSGGPDLSATVVYKDAAKDIAILKITDKAFVAPAAIPYTIKRSAGDIAERIFTLGFPRNDIVYGEGYIAAKTGYNGDTLSCQIDIAANRGNSGSPVLNHNGEVIGILSSRQTSVEGAAFALQSKYIYAALAQLQKDTAYKNIKLPSSTSLRGASSTQQFKKIADFVYMVKVD